MALNPRQIEAFRRVMQTGSMTVAAELLNITQPAVSRLIKDLEQSLGVRLFRREGNRLAPSVEAKRLFSEVDRLYIGLERVERLAEDLKGLRHGSLSIASMSALSLSVLSEGLQQFALKRPGLMISLNVRTSLSVLEAVALGQFDLGFAHLSAKEYPGLEIVSVWRSQARCVLPSGHRLAEKEVIHLSDLHGEYLISIGNRNSLRNMLEKNLDDAGIQCRRLMETTLAQSACAMVSGGLGIAVCDPFTARYPRYPGLVSRRLEPAISYEFAIVRPFHEERSQAVQEFLKCMNPLLEKEFIPDRPVKRRLFSSEAD